MKKWRSTTLAALAALLLLGDACGNQDTPQQNEADAVQVTDLAASETEKPQPQESEMTQTEANKQVFPKPSFSASARPEAVEGQMMTAGVYSLLGADEVNGRQGVCCEDGSYWVSGSASLAKYDEDWNLIAENKDPFEGYEVEVNHIADIDVYNNELYIGAEYFMDGVGKNIQIAVYDGDTLELKRTFPFEAESGQLECSGIAVDPDTQTLWMCSWVGEESGRYLYSYDLESGEYLGKVHMQMAPQWIQGIAYHEGYFYLTADDGTADDGEPDHLYRTKIEKGASNCFVTLERTFDDVEMPGEIEGLTFDEENGTFLLLHNHGARIVLGMPKGFYEGYDREISEVYTYEVVPVQGESISDDSSDFVLVSEVVPDAILEIRYYSTYNFVGERIDGYEEPVAILTREAAEALKEVSDDLMEQGYRLKIFDAYRPQQAVTHFVNWAQDADDTRMKAYFYPELSKDALIPQRYIAAYSGHSSGSTVDLTLFDMETEKEVDMGGTFDYFGTLSHPDYTGITEEQYENRMILREAMMAHGFEPLDTEWWHFTLIGEPYPGTYFNFPVNSESVAE